MATNDESSELYDVIIVGAGVSGATAAYTLKKKCPNLKLLVVEAKGRTGGRTETIQLNCSQPGKKVTLDAGGQWVTDTQEIITELINELDIKTYPQFDTGTKVLEYDGKRVTYGKTIPNISIPSLLQLNHHLTSLTKTADKLSTMDPMRNIELANQLDSLNLEQFVLDSKPLCYFNTTAVKAVISCALRVVYGLEMKQLNTLFALHYVKSGGSIDRLILTEKGCAQEKRVKGGTQQISTKLIERSEAKLLLNNALVQIDQSESKSGKIKVVTENTQTKEKKVFMAKRVISSMPVNQYINVNFEPELPFFKRNVFKFMQMGNYVKFIVTYKRAFWRENGYSGESICDGSVITTKAEDYVIDDGNCPKVFPTMGPVNVTYDATSDDGEPALLGFVGGQPCVDWLDQSSEHRKNEIISSLARFFGKEAHDYVDFHEKVWSNEPYTGGCPTVNVSCNDVMKDYARATREPFHNVHFCGTESATKWQGYMDGAAESGIRAANEVLYKFHDTNDKIEYDYEKTYYFQREENLRLKEPKTGCSILDFFGLGFVSFIMFGLIAVILNVYLKVEHR